MSVADRPLASAATRTWLGGLVVCLLVVAGCPGGKGREEPSANNRKGSGEASSAARGGGAAQGPAWEEAGRASGQVVATFGDHEISAAKLASELALRARVSTSGSRGPLPRDRIDDKGFYRTVLVDLIDRGLVRAEAKRRGLHLGQEQRSEELARDPGDGSPEWKQLIEDRLLARELARDLLGPLDEERLRAYYRRQEERIEVRVVMVPRTPTSAEVDRFLEEQAKEVDSYYRQHREEFRTPVRRRVRYLSVTVPPRASEQERIEVQLLAEGLREQVASGRSEMVDLVRRHSQHSSRKRDGLVGPVLRAELPAAFSVPVGKVSRVHHDLAGYYFVQVLDEEAPSERPLDAALRREVAARAVVAARENRRAWRLAKAVRRGLAGEAALGPPLQEGGLHLQSTGLFARGSGDHLPGVGLVPRELIERLFATQLPAAPEPVLEVGQDLLVVQVIDRQEPQPDTFNARKEDLAREMLAREARPALTRWLAEQPERQSVVIDYEAAMAVTP